MTEKQEALKALDWLANTSVHPHTEEIMARHEAIRAALTEAPKVDGWQPIETAPKDGTEIFLSLWSGHPSRKTSFCWATSGFYKNGNWYGRDPMIGRLVPPSHWMKINPPCEEGDRR